MAVNKKQASRRKFIQQTTVAGVGLMLTKPLQLFSQTDQSKKMGNNIQSKGYNNLTIPAKYIFKKPVK